MQLAEVVARGVEGLRGEEIGAKVGDGPRKGRGGGRPAEGLPPVKEPVFMSSHMRPPRAEEELQPEVEGGLGDRAAGPKSMLGREEDVS